MRNQGPGSWTARRARMAPDRVALRQQGRSWTYGELDRRSTALAHGLRRLGAGRRSTSRSASTTPACWSTPPAPPGAPKG